MKSCFSRNYDFPFPTHFPNATYPKNPIRVYLEDDIQVKGECIHHVPDYPGGPFLDLFVDAEHFYIAYEAYTLRVEEKALYLSGPSDDTIRITQVLERVILPLHLYLYFPDLIPLHGGAVLFDKHAYIFIGPSGAGKSTTLSELLDRGATLMADDMVFVDSKRGSLLPGLPTLRLLEPRQHKIKHLARVGPKIQKWWHLVDQAQDQKEYPIKTLFILAPGEEGFRSEKVFGLEKFGALLSQSFGLQSHDEEREKNRFEGLSRIASAVPVERLHFKRGKSKPIHIDQLCDYLRR